MSFDPSDNIQDQEALLAPLQRLQLLKAQNQKQSIPENRKCPWCGGGLPGQYSKCQNCASDISWVDGFPCKPQEEEHEIRKSIEKWEKANRLETLRLAKENKLKDEIAARVVKCTKCGCRVPQLYLNSTNDTCKKCICKRAVSVFGIMAVLALVYLYYLFSVIVL